MRGVSVFSEIRAAILRVGDQTRRRTSLVLACAFLVATPSLFLVDARAEHGRLVWEARLDVAGGLDQASDVALGGNRAFAVGSGQTLTNGFDFLVQSYSAATGETLWFDQVDGGDGDLATAVTANGKRAFAVGTLGTSATNNDFAVRAYGADGALLWSDLFDLAGLDDRALAVATDGRRLFAAGEGGLARGTRADLDWLVRAYDARSGHLLWTDRFDQSRDVDASFALTTAKGVVFATGESRGAGGSTHLLVRAYDAQTGALLWMDRFAKGGGGVGLAAAAGGRRLFVAGSVTDEVGIDDFVVRAYDTETGDLLWSDAVDTDGQRDQATTIAASRGLVFVGGFGVVSRGDPADADALVRAYDGRSGDLMWADSLDMAGGDDFIEDASAAGKWLSVAGQVTSSEGDRNFLVRTYAAQTGALLWTDQFDAAGKEDATLSVASDRRRVVSGGWVRSWGRVSDAGDPDFLVRTYER